MFLHKDGVKYFLAELKLKYHQFGKIEDPYKDFQIWYGNLRKIIGKLNDHLTDCEDHIDSENTVLKKYWEHLHTKFSPSIKFEETESDKLFQLRKDMKLMIESYS